MVKLYSVSVLRRTAASPSSPTPTCVLLKGAYDLQSVGFFQRGSVQEFLVFTSNVLVERTEAGNRRSVTEQGYMCHVFVRGDGLSGVLVSDTEYPARVAHSLLTKVLEDVGTNVPGWPTGTPDTFRTYTALDTFLARYQNPREADALSKIQAELDETKIIMTNTIEAVLERGEKLDDLVAKSEGLSAQSKMFYKTARKTNSCCNF